MCDTVIMQEQDFKVELARGSKVSVFGCEPWVTERLQREYRVCDCWQEDTRFAIIGGGEWLSHAHTASAMGIPYSLVGINAIATVAEKLLFSHTCPFISQISVPKSVFRSVDEKRFYVQIIALAFSVAEEKIKSVLKGEKQGADELAVLKAEPQQDAFLFESFARKERRCDGLTQALAALLLLLKKEEKEINADDCIVLLASSLIKVYNIFVSRLPRALFPPDENARKEAVEEFFGTKCSSRRILTEYEVRRKYFLLERNQTEILEILSECNQIIQCARRAYEGQREDFGFCYGCDRADEKFAVFMAPSVMPSDTLLDFICDCGVADEFI